MATILHGHSTEEIKQQIESVISYNFGAIRDVGEVVMSAPGSAAYTEDDEYDLPDLGADIIIRTNQNIVSEQDMVVTITGTDGASQPLTGTATIGARVAESQSYNVIPSTVDAKFKTITNVAVTNGIAGDGFDICVLPDEDDDVEIAFDQGLSLQKGTQVKPVYRKFELDHTKRIRGENTLTISQWYVHNKDGLARISNREVTLIQHIKDNGGNQATEVRYIEKCRLGISLEAPSDENGELTANGEGSYGREFIFS